MNRVLIINANLPYFPGAAGQIVGAARHGVLLLNNNRPPAAPRGKEHRGGGIAAGTHNDIRAKFFYDAAGPKHSCAQPSQRGRVGSYWR